MCYFPDILDFEYDIILINFSLLCSQFLPLFHTLLTCSFKFGIKMLRTVAAFRELQEEVHNLEKSPSESSINTKINVCNVFGDFRCHGNQNKYQTTWKLF